jgi:predicted homoserine dehydrogenase-like protein
MLLSRLKRRADEHRPIRVGVIGAGSMGAGLTAQLLRTDGIRLVWVCDLDVARAHAAVRAAGTGAAVIVGDNALGLLETDDAALDIDVMVESSNVVVAAAYHCLAAIDRGAHVVLMNAEVDLAFGSLLAARAAARGVVVTSDAGDQHGVLKRLIDEVELWGVRVVQIGNIKGFLDRYQTADGLIEEAATRQLNPVQCCAYTDGTKLNIEMAVIANATGAVPTVRGMVGPRAAHVSEVLGLFDFRSYPRDRPVVDYILGAEPGGGVYVVGFCDDPRPYHLCHLETTYAIGLAALLGEAVAQPLPRRACDVFAFAKRDLSNGERLAHGIGGDHAYGLIDRCEQADTAELVPIWMLDASGRDAATLTRPVRKDQPIRMSDVEFHDARLRGLVELAPPQAT